jgi:hypothetical protein
MKIALAILLVALLALAWRLNSMNATLVRQQQRESQHEWIKWRGAALEQWAPVEGYDTESACKEHATADNAAAVEHGGHLEFTCFPQTFAPPQKKER